MAINITAYPENIQQNRQHTLLIGLGGTGCAALQYLMELENQASDEQAVSFLALDSDSIDFLEDICDAEIMIDNLLQSVPSDSAVSVYVISSVCGGTGSAYVLDLSNLLCRKLQELYGNEIHFGFASLFDELDTDPHMCDILLPVDVSWSMARSDAFEDQLNSATRALMVFRQWIDEETQRCMAYENPQDPQTASCAETFGGYLRLIQAHHMYKDSREQFEQKQYIRSRYRENIWPVFLQILWNIGLCELLGSQMHLFDVYPDADRKNALVQQIRESVRTNTAPGHQPVMRAGERKQGCTESLRICTQSMFPPKRNFLWRPQGKLPYFPADLAA